MSVCAKLSEVDIIRNKLRGSKVDSSSDRIYYIKDIISIDKESANEQWEIQFFNLSTLLDETID